MLHEFLEIPLLLRRLAVGSEPERGKRGGKRQHQGANEEISSDMYHSEDSDRSHETNEKDVKDDEHPRLAKRRKLLSAPVQEGLMHRSHNNTLPSAARRDIDDTPSQADYGHLPTPVDDEHCHTLRSSRSPPAPAESTPVAEYQEWPFQGFLKRTKIGNEPTYNLEFQLSHVPEHLHLPVLFRSVGHAF